MNRESSTTISISTESIQAFILIKQTNKQRNQKNKQNKPIIYVNDSSKNASIKAIVWLIPIGFKDLHSFRLF